MFPSDYFAEAYFSPDYWPPLLEIEQPPTSSGGFHDEITIRRGDFDEERKRRLIYAALLAYGALL